MPLLFELGVQQLDVVGHPLVLVAGVELDRRAQHLLVDVQPLQLHPRNHRNQRRLQRICVHEPLRINLLMQRVGALPGHLDVVHGVANVRLVQLGRHPVLRLQALVQHPPQRPLGHITQAVPHIAAPVLDQPRRDHRVVQRPGHLHPRRHQALHVEGEVVAVHLQLFVRQEHAQRFPLLVIPQSQVVPTRDGVVVELDQPLLMPPFPAQGHQRRLQIQRKRCTQPG